MDNNNHEVDNKLYDNGNTSYNYNFNVINYDNHYIWGATARIMRMFCKILSETNENK